jgi:hypothetical protein
VKQRLQPQQANEILPEIKKIFKEFEVDDVIEHKPVGITDEQFENVCKNCDQFTNKCSNIVAQKYPGKCDPILIYERNNDPLFIQEKIPKVNQINE